MSVCLQNRRSSSLPACGPFPSSVLLSTVFLPLGMCLLTIISFIDYSLYIVRNILYKVIHYFLPNLGPVIKNQVTIKRLQMRKKANLNFIQFTKSSVKKYRYTCISYGKKKIQPMHSKILRKGNQSNSSLHYRKVKVTHTVSVRVLSVYQKRKEKKVVLKYRWD